jgi:GNAT superfamily N-acetyltransferase
MRIREAGAGDRERVLALLTAQLDEHSVQPTARGLAQAVDRLLASTENGRILVAVESDQVVGVAALAYGWTIELGGPAAWLEELYVDPSHRAHGVGTALVRAARETAAAAGMKAIDLEVEAGHERAANLYRREGFTRFEREHWRLRLEPVSRPGESAPAKAR